MFNLRVLSKSIISQSFKLLVSSCRNESTAPVANALRSRKPKSLNTTVQYYVDKCRVRTLGGRGGDGNVSFLSSWSKEFAGPDGGDGGNGGHVLFLASNDVTNLNHCSAVAEAKHGEKGYNKDCHGKGAEHLIVKVPIGTIVKNDFGKIIADLDKEGTIFMAARGGAGGRGNKFFTSDTEQAPKIAEYGAEGEQNLYTLEIRSMAHIGLLGFPNAGKSTLLRAVSRARPKVAPYPFTTLHPHIGIVQYDDYEQVAIADLPGIIPGSHKNRGLGIQFMQHAERCCCLLYVVDASQPKPWEQVETLKYELSQFSQELLSRPQLILANKIDIPEAEGNVSILRRHFKNMEVIPISGKIGTNMSFLLKKIRKLYDNRIENVQE